MRAGQDCSAAQRPAACPHLRLTERDERLLLDLFEHRALTRSQVIGLGYFGSVARANDRLHRLERSGLIERFFNASSGGAICASGPAAVPILARRLGVDEVLVRQLVRPGRPPAFLEHSLRIAWLRIWLLQSGCLQQWVSEYRCTHKYEVRAAGSGVWKRTALRPDGLAWLAGGGGQTTALACFIEIDLGHVCKAKFRAKVASYQQYRALGLFQEVYGEPDFAVLVVTTSGPRLRSLAGLSRGTDPRFLLTTLDLAERHGPLDHIWTPTGLTTGGCSGENQRLASIFEVAL